MRLLGLVVSNLRAALLRNTLLATLIAFAVVVLLVTSELSYQASSTLDSAIASTEGTAGSAEITFDQTTYGLSAPQFAERLLDMSDSFGAKAALVVAVYPENTSCTDSVRSDSVAAVLSASGKPSLISEYAEVQARRRRDTTPLPREVCLGGSGEPIQLDPEFSDLGASLATPVVAPGVLHELELNAGGPATFRLVVLTNRELVAGDKDRFQEAMVSSLGDDASQAGVPLEQPDAEFVTASTLSQAGGAIGVVYDAIGFAVLALAGLAVLVAQFMNTKTREWFYGLCRVTGATQRDVGAMVVMDVVAVVVAGVLAAVLLVALVQPGLADWAASTGLQGKLNVLRAQNTTRLGLGASGLLFLGGAWPAIQASRIDPVVVLEGSG